MRRKPCPAARRIMLELDADKLEARRERYVTLRRPIPHKLALALEAARSKALAG